nr:transposase [Serratia proteamaculans]ULG13704.1 transposase [Serratia proteamaculans]ULG15155.1 transposase [Serratia proteamaculans]ULG16392.1 transposase [Serratia proteamaculans]ULG19463.1 transposase [Serratia proteamaculans]
MDALATDRRIKCLTCVDDFTKECLTVTVAFGISGVQVTRILDSIALFRDYPATIRTDQGPEFTCRALDQWAFEHGVELQLIQPGKPTQNGFIKSFNGRNNDLFLRIRVVIFSPSYGEATKQCNQITFVMLCDRLTSRDYFNYLNLLKKYT